MWQTKTFKTKAVMNTYIAKHGHKIQWNEIFVNNAYGIEYKRIRVIG